MRCSTSLRIVVLTSVLMLPGFVSGQLSTGVVGAGNTEQTQPGTSAGDPSPNDLRELMRLLADERVQQWLGEQAIAGSERWRPRKTAELVWQEWLAARLESVSVQVQRLGRCLGARCQRLSDFTADGPGNSVTVRPCVPSFT